MPYLKGSRFIIPGTEENLKSAKGSVEDSETRVSPKRTFGNLDIQRAQQITKTAGALDVTRTGPTFNDPRYTSSTLSININCGFSEKSESNNLAICWKLLRASYTSVKVTINLIGQSAGKFFVTPQRLNAELPF